MWCGADLISSGCSSASRAISRIASMKLSSVSTVSVSVGSISSASSMISGK